MPAMTTAAPADGNLVSVRGQRWVVGKVDAAGRSTLVSLEPVARAVDAPRVNSLLADDVGLGKTIEAGLVAQELLLRHRARRIMIICLAGLTIKWHDEMAEKFGLDFTIVDSERAAAVRRTHGSAANPFQVFPLTIVSLPWLRGPKAQRLLDEVLPPDGPAHPSTFDLLILDEAHHVAPAAPKQVYAVDSQQTTLIRRIAPHFTNRLFLSATPHNGYQESFRALLELIDDQRFLRSAEPDPAAVKETVVRRLKRHLVDAEGSARFVEREATAIPVEYPTVEREVHALLTSFAELRRKRLKTQRGRKATDLVTLLLKKRLFSSPAAFAHTLDASEGIDPQNHCHRLINYDIPFNPNKLEQRIGRIDRYGQKVAPDIRQFVGTGFGHAVDPFEADLEFLSRIATKVARMEADLGSVNAVISDVVQRQMAGECIDIDYDKVGKKAALDLGDRLDRDRRDRRDVMLSRDVGLTATYNRVFDPKCNDADIVGLELNHARYAEEVAKGLHSKKAGKTKVGAQASLFEGMG